MGRAATCICNIRGREAMAKILLESKELIVRGELRCVIPLSAIKNIRVEGDALTFRNGRGKVSFGLGSVTAKKWLDAILKPPPTLAQKLGIGPNSVVRVRAVPGLRFPAPYPLSCGESPSPARESGCPSRPA